MSETKGGAANEYVLGTHDAELERLGFQARLWADAAHGAWRSAGLRLGHHALDVGCGPGFASLDMAQWVGSRGRVLGVDESERFVRFAEEQAAARRLPQAQHRVGDVHNLDAVAGAGSMDLCYARWVLCFVSRPREVVAAIARTLRPGGALVVHDYFNYEAMTTAPKREIYTKIVRATGDSWRARGGNPDVVGLLPAMCAEHGLRVEKLEAIQRIARPGESMWYWTSTWWRNYTPRLVEMGAITQAEHEQFHAEMDEIERTPGQFLVLPAVYELIVRRH
ncbi:MAG: methyltransferase domain-containing protein [Planctomycetota bacterium]|nr:methyltransferase domain-containing protein [Planctomycetota bacterium]